MPCLALPWCWGKNSKAFVRQKIHTTTLPAFIIHFITLESRLRITRSCGSHKRNMRVRGCSHTLTHTFYNLIPNIDLWIWNRSTKAGLWCSDLRLPRGKILFNRPILMCPLWLWHSLDVKTNFLFSQLELLFRLQQLSETKERSYRK